MTSSATGSERGRAAALVAAATLLAAPPLARAQASDQAAVAQARADWAQALERKDLRRAVALYADDATFYDPSGVDRVGRAEILTLFARVMAAFDSHIIFHSRTVTVSGDLASDAGDYEETLLDRATGVSHPISGGYLTVLRRAPDGAWRITAQMWTSAR